MNQSAQQGGSVSHAELFGETRDRTSRDYVELVPQEIVVVHARGKDTVGLTFDELVKHPDVETIRIPREALTSARFAESFITLRHGDKRIDVNLPEEELALLWSALEAYRPDLTVTEGPISAGEAVGTPGCGCGCFVPLAIGLGYLMAWMGTWDVMFTGRRGILSWIIAGVLDALIALGAFTGPNAGFALAALIFVICSLWALVRLVKRPMAKTLAASGTSPG